jgi:DNA replication and repair protein RecF
MGWIEKISLSNFRNYTNEEFSFSEGVNLIHGENGIGKTNLLESILIASIGKSNRTKNLKEAIAHGQQKFFINIFYKKDGLSQKIHVNYDGTNKEIFHNKTKHANFSELLGILPSVLYTPSDINIITEEPKYRRRFMDIHLCQSDLIYLTHLTRYNRALNHRNALLKTKDFSSLDIWEEQLANSARIIQVKREKFIKQLQEMFAEEFSYFHHGQKAPKVIYKASPKELITEKTYKESREKDFILGYTTIGPQRDDLIFCLDEAKAKPFSSEGEKRLMVIALKLASYKMMDALVFAMDDYLAFLDPYKQENLLKRLSFLPQVFLTTPFNTQRILVQKISGPAALTPLLKQDVTMENNTNFLY